MKKIFVILLTSIGLLPFASCITSLQPLVTHDKIITDHRIAGNWMHDGKMITVEPLSKSRLASQIQKSIFQSEKSFALTGDPVKDSIYFSNSYAVSYEENGVSYTFVAALMKSGGQLFMDMYPAIMSDSKVPENLASPYDFNNDYLPGFTIAKLGFTPDGLTLNFIDGEYIRQLTREGRIKLKHESDALFNSFIITASSRELQLFLEKYGNDERVFNKESTITLTRQPAHS